MSEDKYNILSGSQNTSEGIKELVDVSNEILGMQENILEQIKLNNLYLESISGCKITTGDICQ